MFWQALAAFVIAVAVAAALMVETRGEPDDDELRGSPMASAWGIAAACAALTPLWFGFQLHGNVSDDPTPWSELLLGGAVVVCGHAAVQLVPAWVLYRWQRRGGSGHRQPNGRSFFPIAVVLLFCVTALAGLRVWMGGASPSSFGRGHLTPGYVDGWGADRVMERTTSGFAERIVEGYPVYGAFRPGVTVSIQGRGTYRLAPQDTTIVMRRMHGPRSPIEARFDDVPDAAWAGSYSWIVSHRRRDGAVSAILISDRLLPVSKSRVAPLLAPPLWPFVLGLIGLLAAPWLWRLRHRVLGPHDLVFAGWLLVQVVVLEAAAYAPYF
jgi:hypothetical protein